MYTNNLANSLSIHYVPDVFVLFAAFMPHPEVLMVKTSHFWHITFTYSFTLAIDETILVGVHIGNQSFDQE